MGGRGRVVDRGGTSGRRGAPGSSPREPHGEERVSGAGLTYDTGALIAAERNDRLMWALHLASLGRGLPPTVPAGVVAEAWRGGPQHHLSRLLKGCKVEELTEAQAREVGALIGRSGVNDTVDVAVAEGAVRRGDAVITSNRRHIEQVADAIGTRLAIHDV